jgi:hypothetical protein
MPQEDSQSEESNPSHDNHMNMIINQTKKLMNDIVIDDEVTRPVKDGFTYLMEDHRRIANHIKMAEEAEDHAEKEKHCRHIVALLRLHARLEEALLYPTLEKKQETHDMVEEAYAEHALAKDLLQEIENLDIGSDEWKAKMAVLRENIEHHVLEEEGELFPKAKSVLSDTEQASMTDGMEQFLQGYEK